MIKHVIILDMTNIIGMYNVIRVMERKVSMPKSNQGDPVVMLMILLNATIVSRIERSKVTQIVYHFSIYLREISERPMTIPIIKAGQ